MLKPYLYLDDTEKTGRGVFTRERIAKGTVIEVAPVIVMSQEDRIHLDKTKLHDYIFEWGKDSSQCCMALGFVPMYNHNYNSNCCCKMNEHIRLISECQYYSPYRIFIA